MPHNNGRPGYRIRRAKSNTVPKPGTSVRVVFGNRESTGTIVGTTITGRYTVKLNIVGADEPVTASFAPDELVLPSS